MNTVCWNFPCRRDDEECLLRNVFGSCVLVDVADVVDGAADRVEERCGTSYIVFLFGDVFYLVERNPVVKDFRLSVEKNCRYECLALFSFLLVDHGVVASDRVGLKSCH